MLGIETVHKYYPLKTASMCLFVFVLVCGRNILTCNSATVCPSGQTIIHWRCSAKSSIVLDLQPWWLFHCPNCSRCALGNGDFFLPGNDHQPMPWPRVLRVIPRPKGPMQMISESMAWRNILSHPLSLFLICPFHWGFSKRGVCNPPEPIFALPIFKESEKLFASAQCYNSDYGT